MTKPLTEWPDDDASIDEWCRPLSATMVNLRDVPCTSMAVRSKSSRNPFGRRSKDVTKAYLKMRGGKYG